LLVLAAALAGCAAPGPAAPPASTGMLDGAHPVDLPDPEPAPQPPATTLRSVLLDAPASGSGSSDAAQASDASQGSPASDGNDANATSPAVVKGPAKAARLPPGAVPAWHVGDRWSARGVDKGDAPTTRPAW